MRVTATRIQSYSSCTNVYLFVDGERKKKRKKNKKNTHTHSTEAHLKQMKKSTLEEKCIFFFPFALLICRGTSKIMRVCQDEIDNSRYRGSSIDLSESKDPHSLRHVRATIQPTF